jgi:hypothetical protein
MKTQEIKTNTIIKAKGFDISIGRELHQIALFSQSSGEPTSFKSIKKGGRLAKIKRKFKNRLSSSTHFFFERMTSEEFDTLLLFLK